MVAISWTFHHHFVLRLRHPSPHLEFNFCLSVGVGVGVFNGGFLRLLLMTVNYFIRCCLLVFWCSWGASFFYCSFVFSLSLSLSPPPFAFFFCCLLFDDDMMTWWCHVCWWCSRKRREAKKILSESSVRVNRDTQHPPKNENPSSIVIMT